MPRPIAAIDCGGPSTGEIWSDSPAGSLHTGHYQALITTLQFAQRWTARVDWTSRTSAEADLVRTNALRDAHEAEDAGVRLQLP